MRQSAVMFMVLAALTSTRTTESFDPDSFFLPIRGVESITLNNSSANASVGLSFDPGTEGIWCDRASARLDMERKDQSITYAKFTVEEDNHRGGKTKIDMNMIECLTTEKPIYVVRLDRDSYKVYYENVPVEQTSDSSDEEPTKWQRVTRSGQKSTT